MMRFARAKGSKSSNERVPESATSWQDMKRHLLENNKKKESQTDDSKFYEKSLNYNVEKQDISVKWSDFPDMVQNNQKNKKSKLKTKGSKSCNETQKQNESVQGQEFVSEPKKKKRKFQECDSMSSEQIVDNSTEKQKGNMETSEFLNTADKKKKKSKLNLNIDKKLQSPDDFESTLDQTEMSNPDSTSKQKLKGSQKNIKEGFGKEAKKKQSKNLNRFENKQGKFSNNTGKKSFEGEYKRRKPNSEVEKIFINGTEVEISYYDGFPIKKADSERLKELKKEMISRGLPRSEIAKALKLERRKAEKSLAREKKKVCFNCRKSGHTLSECPMLKNGPDAQLSETGICFKCGSTEHTHFECKVTRGDNFKFAQCFICKEQGHIARQCPDNNKGLYPKGGSCRVCGAVTHLKKDCPKYQFTQEENKIVADTINNQNIESLENENVKVNKKPENLQKIIKF